MKGHIRCFFTEKTRDAMSVRAWLRLTRRCTPATRARRPGSSTDIHKVKSPSPRHLSTHSISQSFTHPPACRRPPPNAIWAYRPLSKSFASSLLLLESSSCPRFHICFSPLQESFTGEKSASTLASSTSMRSTRSASFWCSPHAVSCPATQTLHVPPLFIAPSFVIFVLFIPSYSRSFFHSIFILSRNVRSFLVCCIRHFFISIPIPSFLPSFHPSIHASMLSSIEYHHNAVYIHASIFSFIHFHILFTAIRRMYVLA